MKYLFFDIDGTIYGKNRCLSEDTKKVLRNAQKKGNKIFLCTGRALVSISQELLDFGFDGIVCSAGSCVLINGKVVYEHHLDHDLIRRVMTLFVNQRVPFTLECMDVLYQMPGYDFFFKKKDQKQFGNNYELIRQQEIRRSLMKREPISHFHFHKPVYKITFISDPKYNFLNSVKYLAEDFNIVYFTHPLKEEYMNGEIIIKECTKADGIKKVIEYFKGSMEDTIGFGDSMNDYQMLEVCNQSVVYEHAEDKLLKLADYTFGEPDTNGVYKTIEALGLA